MSSLGASARSRVSIVIPTFNRVDLTAQCLDVLHQTAPEAEVIVVDNGSSDDTPELLATEQRAGRILAILNDENRFFGPACNQGACLGERELVLILNNDTIPAAGWLEAMVDCLDRDPAVGAVGARLLYPDGRVQHAGIDFQEPGVPFHVHRFAAGDDPLVLVDRDHPAVTGACLLVPRDLFFEVGAFDEDYVMYVEDVDLCLRIWAAGRRVRYCAGSVVEHLESASTTDLARRDELVRSGWERMHERWGCAWPQAVRALPGWPVVLGGTAGPATGLADARGFVVAAFANELAASPAMFAAFGQTFAADDDVTLVVLAKPGADLAGPLERALAEAGLDSEDCPDLILVTADLGEPRLAAVLDAVYTELPVDGPLAALPRAGSSGLVPLAALARRGGLRSAA